MATSSMAGAYQKQGQGQVMGGKYLTFALAQEEYGFEIIKVREIIGLMKITPVPQTPAYIKGVINLRGQVIPVMDLRLKLGLEGASYGERTSIIVVDAQGRGVAVKMGIIVDAVTEVVTLQKADLEAPPALGNKAGAQFLQGLAKSRDGVKMLLNVDQLVGLEAGRMVEGVGG